MVPESRADVLHARKKDCGLVGRVDAAALCGDDVDGVSSLPTSKIRPPLEPREELLVGMWCAIGTRGLRRFRLGERQTTHFVIIVEVEHRKSKRQSQWHRHQRQVVLA